MRGDGAGSVGPIPAPAPDSRPDMVRTLVPVSGCWTRISFLGSGTQTGAVSRTVLKMCRITLIFMLLRAGNGSCSCCAYRLQKRQTCAW